MNRWFIAFAGGLFGVGIAISGMANPAKVQNFLDIAGIWDPSLALVMGTALLLATPGYYFVLRMSSPKYAEVFSLPTRKDIDGRLILGAMLFGIGWALSGLCPAPALVGVLTGLSSFFVFLLAMLVGMFLHKFVFA
ncbi:Uncharacterised protein [Zhongshania aliphaticivorans]|uniref:Uncharacterized protein n=1 Tax=Zhongshania aliphaticivorans TaxID=1470434 RepID=A0A5S9NAL6_9GAMM|nr:DUF6691 family protein [Zhongshania aliphaticivorans]CAA0087192.1 Uncharacterised protein [Zhongshania aliphaticivorans]CAA0114242.1 Uncharacterised protein [Zhongshania aliphaticivorans]